MELPARRPHGARQARPDAAVLRPEYYRLPAAPPPPTPADHASWPPKVTRIPERPARPPPGSASTPDAGASALCASAAHPRPCRFLLPLRIAEQESKARIHLAQLALLARALNRTLVLPNVGRSKESSGRGWTGARGGSQMISIGASAARAHRFREDAVYSNADVSVLAYHAFGAWERDLPGCFASKLDKLALETMPVFMATTNAINKDGSVRLIGDAVVEAFSSISSRAAQQDMRPATPPDPDVLVVNWDLRHPIFPASATPLRYSNACTTRRAARAKSPYLAVQWRMETSSPELLEDCAHALVDVLSRLLRDFALAENITTVWFASDYPYPVVQHSSSQRRPAVIAKSGTFRDFGVRHEEAIDILRKAL
ncbi:hypothetical protein BJ912DRAFT_931774 [Pholiota molesta]|nr:hypothetical protein BJ912DRAFT_931774 [Pholiota molesta]